MTTSAYTLDLVLNTKGNILIAHKDDIKVHLKTLGKGNLTYACLYDKRDLEAPFISAKMVSSRQFQLEYKDSQGNLKASTKNNFSKAEIIDFFGQFFETQGNWDNPIDWSTVNPDTIPHEATLPVDALKTDVKVCEKSRILDLSHEKNYQVNNIVQLEDLLNNIGKAGTEFAILYSADEKGFIQTTGDDESGYYLEYITTKGKVYRYDPLFKRHEVISLFLRYYQGDRSWVRNYLAEIDESEVEGKEERNSWIGLVIFIVCLGISSVGIEFCGKIFAYLSTGIFCLLNFVPPKSRKLSNHLPYVQFSFAFSCTPILEFEGFLIILLNFLSLFLSVSIRTSKKKDVQLTYPQES